MAVRAAFVFVLSNPALRHFYVGIATDTAPPGAADRAQVSISERLEELRRKPHPFMRHWMWREQRIKIVELVATTSRPEAAAIIQAGRTSLEALRRHLPAAHRLKQQGHLLYVHEPELTAAAAATT